MKVKKKTILRRLLQKQAASETPEEALARRTRELTARMADLGVKQNSVVSNLREYRDGRTDFDSADTLLRTFERDVDRVTAALELVDKRWSSIDDAPAQVVTLFDELRRKSDWATPHASRFVTAVTNAHAASAPPVVAPAPPHAPAPGHPIDQPLAEDDVHATSDTEDEVLVDQRIPEDLFFATPDTESDVTDPYLDDDLQGLLEEIETLEAAHGKSAVRMSFESVMAELVDLSYDDQIVLIDEAIANAPDPAHAFQTNESKEK